MPYNAMQSCPHREGGCLLDRYRSQPDASRNTAPCEPGAIDNELQSMTSESKMPLQTITNHYKPLQLSMAVIGKASMWVEVQLLFTRLALCRLW